MRNNLHTLIAIKNWGLLASLCFFLSNCDLSQVDLNAKYPGNNGGEMIVEPPDNPGTGDGNGDEEGDGDDNGNGDGHTTPPPAPQPTPTPTGTGGNDPECAVDYERGQRGFLPAYGKAAFAGWLGYVKVNTNPGETLIFCTNLQRDTSKLTMMVVDVTGAAQCFYHHSEFIPPAGSGLASSSMKSLGTSSTHTFRNWNGALLPKGVWKLKVTASPDYPNCPMAFQLTVH